MVVCSMRIVKDTVTLMYCACYRKTLHAWLGVLSRITTLRIPPCLRLQHVRESLIWDEMTLVTCYDWAVHCSCVHVLDFVPVIELDTNTQTLMAKHCDNQLYNSACQLYLQALIQVKQPVRIKVVFGSYIMAGWTAFNAFTCISCLHVYWVYPGCRLEVSAVTDAAQAVETHWRLAINHLTGTGGGILLSIPDVEELTQTVLTSCLVVVSRILALRAGCVRAQIVIRIVVLAVGCRGA